MMVVTDKVGRPPGKLGIIKSMECHFSLQCFDMVGQQEGHPACKKKLDVGGDDLTRALHDL